MKFIKSPYEGKDDLVILPSGDWHVGHLNTRYDIIKDWISKLDYKHRGILTGDLLEFATKDSIGNGLFETNMTPQKQIDKVCEMLEPVAQFIDGAVLGNHCNRSMRLTSLDPMRIICDRLNIPYLYHQGFIKYIVNEKCYTINLWHGAGGGSASSTAIQTVEKMADRALADVYCIGHFHKMLKSDRIFTITDPRNMTIQRIEQHFVVCGSALDYAEGYAEQIGLMPRILGFPEIKLYGSKKHKHIKVNI